MIQNIFDISSNLAANLPSLNEGLEHFLGNSVQIESDEANLGVQSLQNTQEANSTIVAGGGFSNDNQAPTDKMCFNAVATPLNQTQNETQSDTGCNYEELVHYLGLDNKTVGWGNFNQRPESDYLRAIQPQDRLMSLNYFSHVYDTVDVKFVNQTNRLTDEGRQIYDEQHSDFGVLCGDNYISSYKEGALFMYSLVATFESTHEKHEFIKKNDIFTNYTIPLNITSALKSISNTVSDLKAKGRVHLIATQIGGDPKRLQYYLSNAGPNLYETQLPFEDLGDLAVVTDKLHNYAITDFALQFNTTTRSMVQPTSLGNVKWQSIQDIYLVAPKSILTPAIHKARQNLNTMYDEWMYYYYKSDQISDDVAYRRIYSNYLTNSSLNVNFTRSMAIIGSQALGNRDLLLLQDGGAADCYKEGPVVNSTYFKKCEDVLHNITAKIQFIKLPLNMQCFKEHYSVQVDFKSAGTPGDMPTHLRSEYINTANCKEDNVSFKCLNVESGKTLDVRECLVTFGRELTLKTSDSTMKLKYMVQETPVVTVDNLLPEPHSQYKAFYGFEKCHPTPAPGGLEPSKKGCGGNLKVPGSLNPFYFEDFEAPKNESYQVFQDGQTNDEIQEQEIIN